MAEITREDAWNLLNEFVESESLIKHCIAVEGVMGYLARKHGEDEEKWRVIGLVHDVDYEKYPDEHPKRAREILEPRSALSLRSTSSRDSLPQLRWCVPRRACWT